jgi:hypothetical protein
MNDGHKQMFDALDKALAKPNPAPELKEVKTPRSVLTAKKKQTPKE